MAELTGLRAVKLPVSDLAASREWYGRVFAIEPYLEFPDADGVVRGLACRVPGGGGLSLRHVPGAVGVEGTEVMLGVADRAALEAWAVHLDGLDVAHSPVIDATVGWLMVLHDPDGHEFHLYTDARHDHDHGDRAGYGREIAADA